MSGLEAAIVGLADVTQQLFEAASILVVTAGGIAFAYAVVSQRFAGAAAKPRQTGQQEGKQQDCCFCCWCFLCRGDGGGGFENNQLRRQ